MDNFLKPPESFDFPFPPYEIQTTFMIALYKALEHGKLAIFESPTGTGKSLSLICGSLRWLVDHENFVQQNLEDRIKQLSEKEQGDTSDWFTSQTKNREICRQKDKLVIDLQKLKKYSEKIANIHARTVELKSSKFKWLEKKKLANEISLTEARNKEDAEEEDCLLEEFTSVADTNSDNSDADDEEEEHLGVKIYICSRTHSQLSQFVGEVLRSPFGKSTRLTTLGSRQTYCINESVRRLKNISLINDRCLDMQKGKKGVPTEKNEDGKTIKRKKTSTGCPYMVQSNIENLKNEALTEVQDIEQLVNAAKDLKACPYYGARAAVQDAQIIVLPYNTLLHKSTREASGVKLNGNVIIIDEAHNLLDAIGRIHSCEITGTEITLTHTQLLQYEEKYSKLFSAVSKLRLNQLIRIVKQLSTVLVGNLSETPSNNETSVILYTLQDFLFTSDVGHYNLYNILEFCKKSKLSHKLHSFAKKFENTVTIEPKAGGISSFLKSIKTQEQETLITRKTEVNVSNPILSVIRFLECLTNHCDDGRILCSKKNTVGAGFIKFLLLNPASHFTDIVKEARAVIVAGGTMQPLSEFRDQLFISAGGDPDRILEFSCGHVIPPENILPIAVGMGPSGQEFNFAYDQRSKSVMMEELARSILNVIRIVPGGIVCFFPSYAYENECIQYLTKENYLEKIEQRKEIFREPKTSAQVEHVLDKYAKAIKECKDGKTGSILFSVVGGKLSEGLNFSNDLGRCVILVGRPYPNIKSPELQEKRNYLNNKMKGTGDTYFENLCMKAVNQSIGRAVRHRNDYATVLLFDKRYLKPSVQQGLPSWIQRSLRTAPKFGPCVGMIAKFFAQRKAESNLM